MIPSYFVDELLNRVDIVDLISPYVSLKKAGSNYLGLCPFHQEKSPSFTVHREKQFYHCFGCGEHGNAIGFLMKYQGLNFPESVEQLAFKQGLVVPEEVSYQAVVTPQERNIKNQQFQLLEQVSRFYQSSLKQNSNAIDYLKKRGLTGEIALRFGLGFAPDDQASVNSIQQLLEHTPDLGLQDLYDLGVLLKNEHQRIYARFRQRIMFPIRNAKGQVIGFGGRVFLPHQTKEAKYLNSPETPLFKKGQELYGLFEAKAGIAKHHHVLVVEGYLDAIALHQFGFTQTVASLGTAISTEQIQTLLKYQSRVVFAFDGDNAGQQAAFRALKAALPLADDRAQIEFVFLPQGQDPDSFVREHGVDQMSKLIAKAEPLSGMWRKLLVQNHRLETPEGRAHATQEVKTQWQLLPESHFKKQMLYEIAAWIQLPIDQVRELMYEPDANKRAAYIRDYATNQATHDGVSFSQDQDQVFNQADQRPINRRQARQTLSKSSLGGYSNVGDKKTYKKGGTRLETTQYARINIKIASLEIRILMVLLAYPSFAAKHNGLRQFCRSCEDYAFLSIALRAVMLLQACLDEDALDTQALRGILIENGFTNVLVQLPIEAQQWYHLDQHEMFRELMRPKVPDQAPATSAAEQLDAGLNDVLNDLIKALQRSTIEHEMKMTLLEIDQNPEQATRYRQLTQAYQQFLKPQ